MVGIKYGDPGLFSGVGQADRGPPRRLPGRLPRQRQA